MRYQVRFVADASLPEGVEWSFARQAGTTYFFVKQSAIDTTTGRCDALARAWEVWESTEAESTLVTLRTFARAI